MDFQNEYMLIAAGWHEDVGYTTQRVLTELTILNSGDTDDELLQEVKELVVDPSYDIDRFYGRGFDTEFFYVPVRLSPAGREYIEMSDPKRIYIGWASEIVREK